MALFLYSRLYMHDVFHTWNINWDTVKIFVILIKKLVGGLTSSYKISNSRPWGVLRANHPRPRAIPDPQLLTYIQPHNSVAFPAPDINFWQGCLALDGSAMNYTNQRRSTFVSKHQTDRILCSRHNIGYFPMSFLWGRSGGA